MTVVPSITRRQLLGGGTALAVGGYGGYRLLEGAPAAEFEGWQPEEGTWPLARYDPANTAHNPHANPPRESPERREVTSVRDSVKPLVGDDRIVLYGSALASYVRETDEITYLSEDDVPHAGVGPAGEIHAVQLANETDLQYDAVSYDGMNETNRISVTDSRPEGLTIGQKEEYVGTSAATIHAIEAGKEDWQVEGTTTALAEGRMYAVGTSDGQVVAYDERSGIDGMLSPGPEPRWAGEWLVGEADATAVTDGRVVAGTIAFPPRTGVVGAYNAETGDLLWEPRSLGMAVATPAVVGDRGYTAVGTDGLDAGRVVALDLATGDTLWEDDTEWYAHSPVVSEETLVVLGDVRRNDVPGDGVVRAYDTASGEKLWTATFDRLGPNGGGVALVGDRVYVTAGTTLYELG